MKPALLFYCQHSLGMGHLVRSFALAEALEEGFDVTFLNGGPLPKGMTPPKGINVVNLPALGTEGPDGMLRSRDSRYSVEHAMRVRCKTLLDMFAKTQPAVVLIELFPFGRKKFAFELVPLLEAARSHPSQPKIVCSLRDILVNRGGEKQLKHDNRARDQLEKYFDAVLVHTDPGFARLEESFQPSNPLRVSVHYTGFVASLEMATRVKTPPARGIVVSAGGGIVGAPIFRAALDAQQDLWEKDKIPMKIITGPFLPEPDWQELNEKAFGRKGLELLRYTPDFRDIIATAFLSVSQCGYNTAMDILRSRIPALIIPYEEGTQSEQLDRAERLQKLGIVRILRQAKLNGETFSGAVRSLMKFHPEPHNLDLNGARNTLRILREVVAGSTAFSVAKDSDEKEFSCNGDIV